MSVLYLHGNKDGVPVYHTLLAGYAADNLMPVMQEIDGDFLKLDDGSEILIKEYVPDDPSWKLYEVIEHSGLVTLLQVMYERSSLRGITIVEREVKQLSETVRWFLWFDA
jgi:hypothetical protein